jgi:hypothetical protein
MNAVKMMHLYRLVKSFLGRRSMKGLELASEVSTKEPYFYGDEHVNISGFRFYQKKYSSQSC